MPRILIATLGGLLGFTLYVMAAVALADHVPGNAAAQALYFLAAGMLWVMPVRWLMLWVARAR